ncbi:MAG: thiolase family protein [Candidatus Binatia bacterium]
MSSSRKYAIAGLGVVAGPQPNHSRRQVAAEAVRRAIADAGLKRADVDGAIEIVRGAGAGERSAYADPFPRLLALPVNFFFSIERGGALAALGISAAMSFLDRGIAKYVALCGVVDDWTGAQETKAKGFRGMVHLEKEGAWGRPLGDIRAFSHHSWMAARHMAEYGTTSRQLGAIAVAERAWACKNPEAKMYGRPMTIEDHQNSPLVVEPYHLLDICLISDGGIAFILTTAERARDLQKPPVYVLGQGFGEIERELWWEKKNYTHMAVKTAKEQAFREAGLELEDVKCAQLYDCFTAEVLFQLEDYGWCKKGEGGPFVASGVIGPGGSIPVNTGGGLLSCYHLADLTGFAEAARQIRAEAGERQIRDCDVAMSTGHGGEMLAPGMCSIHSCTLLGR